MHCSSLRGTSEAEGVLVNVIVNVIVEKRVIVENYRLIDFINPFS